MADSKVSALVAETTAGVTDLLYIVEGATTSKKITFDNFQKSFTHVGIGTTVPLKPLVVFKSLGATALGGSELLRVSTDNNNNVNGRRNEIGFGLADFEASALMGSIITNSGSYGTSDLYFATRELSSNTAPLERMRITSAGNVGIGTTSPSSLLYLSGGSISMLTIDATGNQDARLEFADNGVREWQIERSESTNSFKITETGEAVRMTILPTSGNVGIGTNAPVTKLDVAGSMQVSSAVALSTGGYVRTFAEATGTPSGTTTYFDIAVDVPVGCKLLGAQLRVDTALTAGETWGAAYVTGSTTVLAAAGQLVAKNTKVNKMHVDEITTNTTKVRITRDSGNFTDAAGVIRAIVYYETFSAMGTAA